MSTKQKLSRVATAAVALLVLVGCNGSFIGKGHISSSPGHSRAPLTFKIQCPTGSNSVSGVLSYADAAAGVQLEGRATSIGTDADGPIACDGSQKEGHYTGSYTSTYGPSGTFVMDLLMKAPGCKKGRVSLKVISGVHNGYTNTGCFQGLLRPLDRGGDPEIPCEPLPWCILES